MRARDLGIAIGTGHPGARNAITDVAGVRVGHATIIEGEGPLVVGEGPIRTGVTVIFPHGGHSWAEPVFAGCHRLNGNGEITGLEWVRESGLLMSPIGLTNTHSVGIVRDELVAIDCEELGPGRQFWSLPVVGETWDGILNDVNGRHVQPAHVREAVANASAGAVAEGNVGSGTGMICHEFKGGIGTASRLLASDDGGYTVGVLVQANHGRRERLRINGVAVGAAIPGEEVPLPGEGGGSGSIIVVVATDAPLLPGQCTRLAQRAGLGVAAGGGVGEHYSGDLFLAFSTGNRGIPPDDPDTRQEVAVRMLTGGAMTALFDAVVDSTHEAIVNAMLAAETMVGRDGNTAHGLEPDKLATVMADGPT